MIPYAIIGAFCSLYVLSGVVSYLYDHQWDEFKEILLSALFFPCAALIFLVISSVFGLSTPQHLPDKITLNYLFYDAHVLILLPSMLISAIVIFSSYPHIERWLFDK